MTVIIEDIVYDQNQKDMKLNKNTPYGHLNRGDANPFKVGDKVTAIGGVATVSHADIGPYMELRFPYGIISRYGWNIDGDEWGGINEVYPIDTPAQSETMETLKAAREARAVVNPSEYAFDTKDRRCMVLATAKGFALCEYPRTATQKHPIRAVELLKLRPAPAPSSFPITPNRNAIADNGTVTFDGITLSIEQLQTALDEAKKTIK